MIEKGSELKDKGKKIIDKGSELIDLFNSKLKTKMKENSKMVVHTEYNLDQEMGFQAPKTKAPAKKENIEMRPITPPTPKVVSPATPQLSSLATPQLSTPATPTPKPLTPRLHTPMPIQEVSVMKTVTKPIENFTIRAQAQNLIQKKLA